MSARAFGFSGNPLYKERRCTFPALFLPDCVPRRSKKWILSFRFRFQRRTVSTLLSDQTHNCNRRLQNPPIPTDLKTSQRDRPDAFLPVLPQQSCPVFRPLSAIHRQHHSHGQNAPRRKDRPPDYNRSPHRNRFFLLPSMSDFSTAAPVPATQKKPVPQRFS